MAHWPSRPNRSSGPASPPPLVVFPPPRLFTRPRAHALAVPAGPAHRPTPPHRRGDKDESPRPRRQPSRSFSPACSSPSLSISPEHHHRRRSPLTRPPCSPRLAEESNSSACFLYSISDQGFELGATTAPESSSSAPTVAGAPPPIADALLLLSHHRGLRVPPR